MVLKIMNIYKYFVFPSEKAYSAFLALTGSVFRQYKE